jgi:hypothetical protein
MAHDVFISYSSKDKTVADAVCATLETRKIRCWIAPRDVPPGEQYAAALVNAINDSKVFVLVLSQGSNTSRQVIREVEEAVDHGIPIIPFRIEDVEPTDAMRYYIKSLHWLDAMNPPLERHLGKLADSVQAIMSVGAGEPAVPAFESTIEMPVKKKWPLPIWAMALLALVVILIVGGVGWWATTGLHSTPEAELPGTIVENPSEEPSPEVKPSPTPSEWSSFSFNIPNEIQWTETASGTYTVTGSEDTFAWSEEIIEGDFILEADVESNFESYGEGMIIAYGNGMGWSKGCLIFNVTGYWQAIRANSIYDPDSEALAYIENRLDFNERNKFTMTIEVSNEFANLYVDGEKVTSILLPPEINRSGRIALMKYKGSNSATYSNIRFKSLNID